MSDGRDLVIVKQPFPGALPATIEPHDSGQTWVSCDELEASGIAFKNCPMVGWVRLSTDERFQSEPVVLRTD